MNRKDFLRLRRYFGKTQRQMAQLLGLSLKSIQSFEQGWRKIPDAAERQLLVLLALKKAQVSERRPCWSIKECSPESRRGCPVWEFAAGHFCWFFIGTTCQGEAQESWQQKMGMCRKCEIFQSIFDLLQ